MAITRKRLPFDRSGAERHGTLDRKLEQGVTEAVFPSLLVDPDLIDSNDAVGPEDADEVADDDPADVRDDDIDAGARAPFDPVSPDLGVFDQPALTPALTDQRGAGITFEQFQLRNVVRVARIERSDGRIDHRSSS